MAQIWYGDNKRIYILPVKDLSILNKNDIKLIDVQILCSTEYSSGQGTTTKQKTASHNASAALRFW